MALKDILVHVDNTPPCKRRLEFALAVARQHDAHLTVLFASNISNLQGFGSRSESVLKAAEEAQARFKALAADSGVTVEWRQALIPGSDQALIQEVRTHGRHADLVILGQQDPEARSDVIPPDLPERLMLELGRPVLVVPYAWRFGGRVGRALVAWNGGREAARAINDALPLLQKADWVQVLAVNPAERDREHGPIPCADICLHLARHGVKSESSYLVAHDIDVGNMLLSRAADEAADLLVMGAYGRARFTELVLGGATRHLLRHMTLPVLMSH